MIIRSAADLQRMFEVNVFGVVYCLQAAGVSSSSVLTSSMQAAIWAGSGSMNQPRWPEHMAVQFEHDGPNYNAYCGDEAHANFEPYEPRDGSCSDAPSGRCEKDNYPRWQ
jgi:hypothetical protein